MSERANWISPYFILSLAVSIYAALENETQFVWYPVSVCIASMIEFESRSWVLDGILEGASQGLIATKFALSAIGMYAILGVVGCPAVFGWWILN